MLTRSRIGRLDGRVRTLVRGVAAILSATPAACALAAPADFRLKPDSPAWKLGFKRIPIEKIGLYRSRDRASWPVTSAVRPMTAPPGP
jgi:hypothetical protein